MPIPEWDKFKVDRWDRDLSALCLRHGAMKDKFGDCQQCLMEQDWKQQAQLIEDRRKEDEAWQEEIRNFNKGGGKWKS